MSFSKSNALQQAVFETLFNDTTLSGLIGANVFDAPPIGQVPDYYVLIGEERVQDRSTKTSRAAAHDFSIEVNSERSGFSKVKAIAAIICDLLLNTSIELSSGILVDLSFRNARALRGETNQRRKVVLNFRAYIDET